MKNKNYKIIVLLLTLLILLPNFVLSAFADVNQPETCSYNKTIRVVFPKQEGLSIVEEEGKLSGYTYDYLTKIADYAGWNIEYITFDDSMSVDESIIKAMEMVQNGEADLMGSMLKNDALLDMYDYCEVPYGHVYTTLVALLNNPDITTDSFRYKDTLRVALYEKAKTRNKEVTDYLQSENINYEIVYCQSTDEQFEKLQQGEADVASNVTLNYFSSTKTIATFAPRPFYFFTTKGNKQLTNKIDDYLYQISYAFPLFQNQLQIEYFSDGTNKFFLTDAQQKLLNEKKELNVLCVPNVAPYVMLDENGNLKGMLVDIVKNFAKETGLKTNFTIYDSDKSITDALNESDYDCILGLPINPKYVAPTNEICSSVIDSVDTLSFFKPNYKKDKADSVIALVEGSDISNYQGYKDILYAKNISDLIDLVNSGGADIGFANSYSVNYYIYDKFVDLITNPFTESQLDISIAVSNENGNELLAILNNFIASITPTELSSYYSISNSHRTKNIFEVLARTNPMLIIFSITIFISIVLFVIFLLFTAKRKKKQYELIEKANASKSEFLSRMSHDMRTPMNAIIGFSELGLSSKKNDEKRDFFSKISYSAKYLLCLINDVLDMSKIEEGKMTLYPKPYTFDEFQNSLKTILLPKAEEKGVTFTITNLVNSTYAIEIDDVRLQQIFVNLVNNAIKFTPKGGKVELTISQNECNVENHVSLTFIVKDSGIGISDDFIKNKMFKPFEQEQRKSDNTETGTGLGLSIVKNIVSQMGGTIECTSKMGVGTTFTTNLIVKICDSPSKKADKSVVSYDILNNKKVLLCEDHPLNIQIATKILEKNNMIVTVAQNGKIGVDSFANNPIGFFDIILMDIRMPEMDGLQATKAIRQLSRPDAKTIPIIAMSANAFEEDIKTSLNAGMNAHLSKPIDTKKLLDTLVSQINKSK